MGIRFSNEELKKIHKIQLAMLVELDRICRKYDIKYIISGGTLLGAVRANSFIPWDDDIDVRMERNEYERFCMVCENELDKENFFFQNHKTDSEYPWYYGKLRYKHSRYVREGQEHLKMNDGIFMDILPSDGLPENDFLKKIIIKKCFLLKKCLYASVGRVTEKNTIKRIVYKVMYIIPNKWIFKSFDKMAKKYSDNRYTQLCTYAFVKDNPKKLMKRNWHRDRVEIEFEGRKFFAPKAYKEWLTYTYGKDYMTPPPIDKQIGDNAISYFCIYKEL